MEINVGVSDRYLIRRLMKQTGQSLVDEGKDYIEYENPLSYTTNSEGKETISFLFDDYGKLIEVNC